MVEIEEEVETKTPYEVTGIVMRKERVYQVYVKSLHKTHKTIMDHADKVSRYTCIGYGHDAADGYYLTYIVDKKTKPR